LDAWALVDWDETIRPGFVMIDWVNYLASQGLVPSNMFTDMQEQKLTWERGRSTYPDFIKAIISIYQDVEPRIGAQDLLALASVFVNQDRLFLTETSVGSTVFRLFRDLRVNMHVISGAPLIILHEYQRHHQCIKRVTGISGGTMANDLSALKRNTVNIYSDNPALFGIGDSETDIPLFESAHHPIGINFAPPELLGKDGLRVTANADLCLSPEGASELSAYIRRCYAQAT